MAAHQRSPGAAVSAASAKGQRFERLVADWLKFRLQNDHIDIRPKNGTNDRGDIGGVRTAMGAKVVLELKNHTRFALSDWLDQAEVEACNDDAPYTAVIFKRPRKGKPADQYVLMTAEVFARLIEGGHDAEVIGA